jgi:hypothetical protein
MMKNGTALTRLGNEASALGELSCAGTDFSRDDEDENPRPAMMNESGQIEPVQGPGI